MYETLLALRRLTDSRTRRRLAATVGATAAVTLLDVAALSLTTPLLALLTGARSEVRLDLVTRVFRTTNVDALSVRLALAVLCLFVLRAVAYLVLRSWTFGVLADEETRLVSELVAKYLGAPLEWHYQHSSSSYIRTVVTSVDGVINKVLYPLTILTSEAILAVALGTVVLVTSPMMAGLAAVLLGLAFGALRLLVLPKARAHGKGMEDGSHDLLQVLQQAFSSWKVTTLYGAEDHFASAARGAAAPLAQAKRQLRFFNELPRYYLETATVVSVGIVAAVLIAIEGKARAVPLVGVLAVAGFRLLPSLARISSASVNLRAGGAALSNVLATMEDLPTRSRQPRRLLAEPPKIVLHDLWYRYPGRDDAAVAGVSLELEAGSTTALVGRSGSGKTTLADLLVGLLTPERGIVRFHVDGDEPLDGLPLIGYVPQDVVLVDSSLRANIAFGIAPQDIDEEQVCAAVRQAQLVELVERLPDGLDTEVGERGVRMSGGQRQRVGIARALYRRPTILVFDEATSALDPETEQLVTKTIESLHAGLTILVIAHRLSTVRHADRIAVMDHGLLVDVGTFHELEARSLTFGELLRHSNVHADVRS